MDAKRCARAVVLLLLVAVAPLSAETFFLLGSRIVPSSIQVGDQAELRVRVAVDDPDSIALPAELPSTQWIEVTGIRLIRRDGETEVVVSFSAYRTGTLSLPVVDLGIGVLEGFQVRVESVLPDDGSATLLPVQGQLFAPGTQVLLLVVLVLVIAFPFAAYRGGRFMQNKVSEAIRGWRENRPYRTMLRVLRSMHTYFDRIGPRDFYIGLIDETRRFLSERTGIDFLSATVPELSLLLVHAVPDETRRSDVERLFRHGDLVKFAGQDSDADERYNHLIVVASIVALVESKPVERVVRRSQRPVRRAALPASIRASYDNDGGPDAESGNDQAVMGGRYGV